MMLRAEFLLLFLSTGCVIFGQDVSSGNITEEVEEEVVEASGDNELHKRDVKTMPNIGYLFRGYDILKGNPMAPGKSFDPGFRQMIFDSTYEGDRFTADRRYKIPDYVDITRKKACKSEFSSDTVMTLLDYQKSLLAKASVSGSAKIKVVDAAFSASIEYSRVRQTVESNTKSIIKSEAVCTVYEGMMNTGTPPKLSQNFIAIVARLSKTKNYAKFLDSFGTHFIDSVDMGARYTKLQEISKKKQEKMQKDGIDIKRTASLSAAGIGSVSTENQFKNENQNKETFEKAIESVEYCTVGSKIPEDGKDSTWMAAAIEDPLPVFYSLRSILEIFDSQYFKGTDINYQSIKTELAEYLKSYCKTLKSSSFPDAECEGPPKGCKGGSQCSVNAICTDTLTRYKCRCKAGFTGNGKVCDRVPKWKMTRVISHKSTKGSFGTWGGPEYCNGGIFARGFTLRAEKPQGRSDDTGANAVCLKCGYDDVCSKEGKWGDWSEPKICPKDSFLSGWRQNNEDSQGLGDDTSLNNVEYRCRDIETWESKGDLKAEAKEWGTWSRWKECPKGQFICGLETRVEDPGGDDTALNDIKHQCCRPILQKKKASKAKIFREKK